MMRYYVLLTITVLMLLTACGPTEPEATNQYEEYIVSSSFPQGDAAHGEELFSQNPLGEQASPSCITCHAAEDIALIGPSQVGMATRAAEDMNSEDYTGKATTVEGYLWEAVVDPHVYTSPGFASVMYDRYDENLTEQEIADLVAYMLTLE